MGYGQQERQGHIYCGKGRETGGQYGTFYSLYLVLDDIPEEFIRTNAQGKRTVNLTMSELRQPDDRGNTHTVMVDKWKPDGQRHSYQPRTEQPRPRQSTQAPQRQNYAPRQSAPAGPEMFDSDQIPF